MDCSVLSLPEPRHDFLLIMLLCHKTQDSWDIMDISERVAVIFFLKCASACQLSLRCLLCLNKNTKRGREGKKEKTPQTKWALSTTPKGGWHRGGENSIVLCRADLMHWMKHRFCFLLIILTIQFISPPLILFSLSLLGPWQLAAVGRGTLADFPYCPLILWATCGPKAP